MLNKKKKDLQQATSAAGVSFTCWLKGENVRAEGKVPERAKRFGIMTRYVAGSKEGGVLLSASSIVSLHSNIVLSSG